MSEENEGHGMQRRSSLRDELYRAACAEHCPRALQDDMARLLASSLDNSDDSEAHDDESMLSLVERLAQHHYERGAGSWGRTALHWACWSGHGHIVSLLLASGGADPNEQNYDGNTPLTYACLTGRKELALLLVKAGADINLVNKAGRSPLRIRPEWGDELVSARGKRLQWPKRKYIYI